MAERVALVRAWVGENPDLKQSTAARRLGVSRSTVYEVYRAAGLLRPAYPGTAERRREVARLHRLGLSPARIYRRIRSEYGVKFGAVLADHRRLGLTPNKPSAAEISRSRSTAARRQHGKDKGYAMVVSREHEKVDSVLAGWPRLTARARRHLELIEQLGPATVADHAERSGLKLLSARLVFNLMKKAGALVQVGARRTAVWGGSAPVYDLSPEIKAARARVKAWQSGEVPP